MNLYTNSPSRFGGCYATFDPTASQATVVSSVTPPVTVDSTTVGNYVGGKRRGYQFTPFNPGRLKTELARQKAATERTAMGEAFAKAVEDEPPVPDKPEVVFTSVQVEESLVPELGKKLEEYERIADEISAKTKARMEEAEEEELLVMLLAQDI